LIHLADTARRPLVVTLGTSGLVQTLSILTGVILARVLGPDHRGELGTAILWPSFVASLAILGFSDAVSVLTARHRLSSAEALRSALPAIALLAIVGMLAAAAIEWAVAADLDRTAKSAAAAYLIFIPINMVTLTLVGALSGARRFGALNAVRLSVVVVAAVGLPLWAVAGRLTVLTAVVTYLAANLVALGIAIAAVVPIAQSRAGRASWSGARLLLGFGVRSHAGVVAGQLSERLDQLAISAFLPPRELGLYLAAVTLSAGTGIVSSSITMVLLPTIAAMSPELRLKGMRRYLRITALLTAAIAAVTAAVATIVLKVFFGAAFEAAALPAQILLAGSIPLGLSRSLAAASRACGQPGRASRAEWLGLVFGVPAYVLLLPEFGIVGAAWASVVAYSASLLFQANVARSALGARSVLDLVRAAKDGEQPPVDDHEGASL
jgi:O-antigen/teichoic acid export membrane protein